MLNVIELFSSEWPICISDIVDVGQRKDIGPFSPLRGRALAAVSLRVGDGEVLQVTQVTAVCKSSANG